MESVSVCVWCRWLVPAVWVELKLDFSLLLLLALSLSAASAFLNHRKSEIKEGLWKHQESCNYLLSLSFFFCRSVLLSLCVSFSLHLPLSWSLSLFITFSSISLHLFPFLFLHPPLFYLRSASLSASLRQRLIDVDPGASWLKAGWEEKRLNEKRG